jgi:hypothetical protein
MAYLLLIPPADMNSKGNHSKEKIMKSENYVTVLAILNAMTTRIATSLPQIERATRGLFQPDIQPGVAANSGTAKDANV